MASYFVTSIVEGQWFYTTDADPGGVISAPRGSVALRTDAGNESIYLNVTVGVGTSTNWSRVLSPDINKDLNLTGVDQITLADNANPALDIGSTGLLNLLRFITTNGAERMIYSGAQPFNIASGGLSITGGSVALPEGSLNVASASIDAANLVITAGLFLPVDHGAGASFIDYVLPIRVGGWRVVDAYIVSGGAAAGSVQLQTAGGVANITNTMVPGAAAGDITRAANVNLTNGTLASGATLRVNVAAGALAGTCFVRIEPR